MKSVSVVIPCFRSTAALDQLVEELSSAFADRHGLEIVLVNDSGPEEPEEATRIRVEGLVATATCRVKAINLALNAGEHAAVMAGLRESCGDCVVVMDDDGQNPAAEAVRLVEALSLGYDVVFGAYRMKHHHWFRNLGSRIVNKSAELLVRQPKGLYLCSFKAMSRRLVDRITTYPGAFPYIDGLVFRCTRRVGVLEVAHFPREDGRSGYTAIKLLKVAFDMAFGFSVLPLRAVAALGVGLALTAMTAGVFFLLEFFLLERTVTGWTSLAVLLSFLGGVILFGIGVLGEYLGRLYLTSTGAVPYIIENRLICDREARQR
ncbi:MAG: glycosyltransferase [Acidobacteria bacterium]|nr:glycosyltransferase [Acidobacteriota bacterium]